ncbi:NUDIX hydrolase, partial [Xanthovirga aplysinae]|uniref:NUDIX hydrolase n=1 Tax=Xanthovirga aplysinae TaxID=2529853 RepID=UPI0012BC04F5
MLFKIAVDCVILAYDHANNQLKILLIKRLNEPEKGRWALPGGFVNKTEEFIDTAKNKLWLETGVSNVYLEQLKAYSLTDSSPQERIASIAYYALIKFEEFKPSSKSSHLFQWVNYKDIPELPFDHQKKVNDAIERIKESIKTKHLVFHLLPKKFPLNQLQKFYEELYEVKIDNRNFRKKIKGLPYVAELDEMEANV